MKSSRGDRTAIAEKNGLIGARIVPQPKLALAVLAKSPERTIRFQKKGVARSGGNPRGIIRHVDHLARLVGVREGRPNPQLSIVVPSKAPQRSVGLKHQR